MHRINTRCGFDYYFAWDQTDNRYYQGKFYTNIEGLTTETYEDFSFKSNPEPNKPQSTALVDTTGSFSPDVLAHLVTDFALTRGEDEKFFVYHAMLLPHNPVVTVPGFEHANTMQERFDGQVQYLDQIVGRVNTALAEAGLDDDVLVMFTSDNGARSNIETPWMGRIVNGGKFGFTDAGVHVPLVAKYSGGIRPGSSSAALSDCSDLLPTIYDAVGVANTEIIDGHSFWDTMLEPESSPPIRSWVYLQVNTRQSMRDHTRQIENDEAYDVSVRNDRQQLLFTHQDDICIEPGIVALYDALARMRFDFGLNIPMAAGDTLSGCTGIACTQGQLVCVEDCGLDVFNCIMCRAQNSSQCMRCEDGYTLDLDDRVCNLMTGTTLSAIPWTTTTTTTTTTTSETTAAPCIVENCASCNGNQPWRCAVCKPGFERRMRGRECLPPFQCEVEHCLECMPNRSRRCKRCENGFITRMQRTLCDKPIPCQVEHCEECIDKKPFQCKRCIPGYARFNNRQRCGKVGLCHVDNCAECHHGKPFRCHICEPGYRKIWNNTRCVRRQ